MFTHLAAYDSHRLFVDDTRFLIDSGAEISVIPHTHNKSNSKPSSEIRLVVAYLGTRHFIHFIEGRRIVLRTDHKLFTSMFTLKTEKIIDRQVRQIRLYHSTYTRSNIFPAKITSYPTRYPGLK